MANWIGVITDQGKDLLTQWVAGKTLNFDAAVSGKGVVAEEALRAQTTVTQQMQDTYVVDGQKVQEGARVRVQVQAHSTAYQLHQIGIWASVEHGQSVMVALFQHDVGISVPSLAESPDFSYTFFGLIVCSNDGPMTVTVDPAAVLTRDNLPAAGPDQLGAAKVQAGGGAGDIPVSITAEHFLTVKVQDVLDKIDKWEGGSF